MKEIKPFTADEFLTEWSKGRTFSEETRDQSYIDFAEAFHREKLKEEEDGSFMLSTMKGQNIGRAEERKRILGIIEENSWYEHATQGWICDKEELTQKIKEG